MDREPSEPADRPATPPELVSAREAVAILGIRTPTLYAYVSRGLVRSVPGPTRRDRRYVRDDIDRLKARRDARAGHAAAASESLRFGQPVLDSAITRIETGDVRYRGASALALAREGVEFEAVAERLWTGETPADRPVRWPAPVDTEEIEGPLRPRPTGLRPIERLALRVLLASAADGGRHAGAPPVDEELGRARALLAQMPAAVADGDDRRRGKKDDRRVAARPAAARDPAAGERPRGIAHDLAVAFATTPEASVVAAIDAALVLCADHELNASTFAVRVAASAGGHLYACIGAGLDVLSGARHGGAPRIVDALIASIGAARNASAEVAAGIRRGATLPGFGHRLYPRGDPRAAPLLARAVELARSRRRPPPARQEKLATLLAVIDAVGQQGGERPTLDTGLLAVTYALGLDAAAAEALFAVGRMAGWVAHMLEQRAAGYLVRPRARYVGV